MNRDKSYLGSIDCIYSLIMNFVFVTFTENLLLSSKRIFINLTILVTVAISSLVPILFASDHES